MDLGLRGKVAAVSGASQGIGRAIAESLAREGMHLAICARRPQPLEGAAEGLRRATGARVWAVGADMTLDQDVRRFVDGAAAHFGALHVLVVNLGSPASGGFLDKTDAQWLHAFEVGVMAGVRMIRAAVRHIERAGGGAIVNNSSFLVRQPQVVYTLSSSTRPGLAGLTKTLAEELAPLNIRINSIAPGYVLTPALAEYQVIQAESFALSAEEYAARAYASVPLKRAARPEEIGDVVAFLASERASYITGAMIAVDGGLVRSIL